LQVGNQRMTKEFVKKILLDKTCKNCLLWAKEFKTCSIATLVSTETDNEYSWCEFWKKK